MVAKLIATALPTSHQIIDMNENQNFFAQKAVFDAKNIKAITDFLLQHGVVSLRLAYNYRYSNDEGGGSTSASGLYVQKPGEDVSFLSFEDALKDAYLSDLFGSKVSIDKVSQKYDRDLNGVPDWKRWTVETQAIEIDPSKAIRFLCQVDSEGMQLISEDFMQTHGTYSSERESDDEGGSTSSENNEGLAKFNLATKALSALNSDGDPAFRQHDRSYAYHR